MSYPLTRGCSGSVKTGVHRLADPSALPIVGVAVPAHAQQPVSPVPGVGIHPVAGERVEGVVGVVVRGRRAVDGDNLLGAVARRVVGEEGRAHCIQRRK